MTTGLFWAASGLAAVFAGEMADRYRKTHSPFYGWWMLSFLLYVVTFVVEALSVSSNYTRELYQWYVIGSGGLVIFMSVGTSFLAFPRAYARAYAVIMACLFVGLTLSVTFSPPVLGSYSWVLLNQGKAITGWTQVLYIVGSSVGGTVVFLGAGWSWWKTRRHYNLFIALGVLVSSAAGTLASQGAAGVLFPLTNIVALLLIFTGYLYSREAALGRVVARASERHQTS